ncbi:MAG TPA: amidohydrolase family protein, partial [Actinopolymorphaceae bacterium]|nr:amidohydrolase family protein [Actinopolymorphaceae bacterium]
MTAGQEAALVERAREALFARQPLSGMRVVDAHAHAGPYSRFFIPDNDLPSMVHVMDRCGVGVALVSSHLALELHVLRGNEVTAELVDRSQGRFRGLLAVNPHHGVDKTLQSLPDDRRFVGVKVHPDLHEYPLTATRYRPVFEAASELGFPVLVHSWAGSAYNDLRHFDVIGEPYPEATVVLGHGGARRSALDDVAELASHHPNLVLETCGSFMTGAWIRRLVGTVGADRVLYGSDFPFLDMRYALGRVLFSGLDDADLVKVMGGSLCRLVRSRRRRLRTGRGGAGIVPRLPRTARRAEHNARNTANPPAEARADRPAVPDTVRGARSRQTTDKGQGRMERPQRKGVDIVIGVVGPSDV